MRTLDSDTDAADQNFAKLVKASGSEYTKIATAGNFGDLRRNVLSTGETVYMASENSAAVNSDLKLPAVGSLGAAAGQASYLPSQPFRTVGASGQGYTRSLGRKVYELTDHLGNDHATVSDRRKYDATLKASLPEVKSLADYYPFGMQMPGKKLNPDGYRYGFNGMEKDDEAGSTYTTPFRQYNTESGRWITIDPLASKFPSQSPYIGMNNNPIFIIDPTGKSGKSTDKGVAITVYIFTDEENADAKLDAAKSSIEKAGSSGFNDIGEMKIKKSSGENVDVVPQIDVAVTIITDPKIWAEKTKKVAANNGTVNFIYVSTNKALRGKELVKNNVGYLTLNQNDDGSYSQENKYVCHMIGHLLNFQDASAGEYSKHWNQDMYDYFVEKGMTDEVQQLPKRLMWGRPEMISNVATPEDFQQFDNGKMGSNRYNTGTPIGLKPIPFVLNRESLMKFDVDAN